MNEGVLDHGILALFAPHRDAGEDNSTSTSHVQQFSGELPIQLLKLRPTNPKLSVCILIHYYPYFSKILATIHQNKLKFGT